MGKKNKNCNFSQFDEPEIVRKKKFSKPVKEEKSFEEEFFSLRKVKPRTNGNRKRLLRKKTGMMIITMSLINI